MSTDTLTLGGFAFTGYSTPDVMMGGGRQAMVVHKLPGGMRVIDTLGHDIPATSAIAAVGTAERNEFFAAETDTAATTVAGLHAHRGFIDEFHVLETKTPACAGALRANRQEQDLECQADLAPSISDGTMLTNSFCAVPFFWNWTFPVTFANRV